MDTTITITSGEKAYLIDLLTNQRITHTKESKVAVRYANRFYHKRSADEAFVLLDKLGDSSKVAPKRCDDRSVTIAKRINSNEHYTLLLSMLQA